MNQLSAARKLLSDHQLIAFIRAAAAEEHPHAPGYFCRDLDEGRTLDVIFRPPLRADLMHAILKVQRLAPRTFRITTGYRGEVGDGGTWRVVFTAGGAVRRLEAEGFWMH